jgi:hypothetical protein
VAKVLIKAKRRQVRGDCDKVGESEVANSAGNEGHKSMENCGMSLIRDRSKTKGIWGIEVLRDGEKVDWPVTQRCGLV